MEQNEVSEVSEVSLVLNQSIRRDYSQASAGHTVTR